MSGGLVRRFFMEQGTGAGGARALLGAADNISDSAVASLGKAIGTSENAVDDFRRWIDESRENGTLTAAQALKLTNSKTLNGLIEGIGLRNQYLNQVDEILSSGGSRETIDAQLQTAQQNFLNTLRTNDDIIIQPGDVYIINDTVESAVRQSRSARSSFSNVADTGTGAGSSSRRSADAGTPESGARNTADGAGGSSVDRINNMWTWHRIRMAGLGITVGGAGIVLGDQFIGEGNLARSAGDASVEFGKWLSDWNPELGQIIMDIAPDIATTTMSAMSAGQDAAVRAASSALEAAGHEEIALGLRVSHVLAHKTLGIAIEVADEDEQARSAVFIDEFCREAGIEKEALEAFLRERPVMLTGIQGAMETFGGNINEVFPDLEVPNSQNLSEEAVRAMIQQERESYQMAVDQGRTLTDLATNPLIPGSAAALGSAFTSRLDALEQRIDSVVENSTSSLFNFAQENSDQIQLGFWGTIVMAVAGWLSGVFGQSATEGIQRFAMDIAGVDEKFDNLRRSVARGDVISQGNRDRAGVLRGQGPTFDADVAPA